LHLLDLKYLLGPLCLVHLLRRWFLAVRVAHPDLLGREDQLNQQRPADQLRRLRPAAQLRQ
jgi:hypothetical protein